MCHYYYAIIRWRDCEKDPKHTGSIRKEYTCEEAEKTGKTCPNPTEMPWQSGTTSIKGQCYKCGKPFCRKAIVPILTRYSQFHLNSLPNPSIICGDYERQAHPLKTKEPSRRLLVGDGNVLYAISSLIFSKGEMHTCSIQPVQHICHSSIF
jgi:hypothetical protein